MLFSIVVPTCRRETALRLCLARLAPETQQFPTAEYEIIVSDDGDDETLRARLAVDFAATRFLAGPRRGPAANRNHGAAAAKGAWLVFLDDDCEPEPGLLNGYRSALTDPAHVPAPRVLEGAIRPERPRARLDEEAPINETGGLLWSCNFAVQADFFRQLGGFSEAFPYAALEDVELRERIREAGESPRFVPAACVVHPWKRMVTDARRWRMHIDSHRILYSLRPGLRPNAWSIPTDVARAGIKLIIRDGPRYGYRGLAGGLRRYLQNSRLECCLPFVRARPPGR